MKASQIRKSIKKRQLQLEGMDKFTHFQSVLYMIFVAAMFPVMMGYEWFRYGEISSPGLTLNTLLMFTVVPAGLAYGFFIYQNRQLRLTRIITGHSSEEIRSIVVDVAKRNDWEVRNNRRDFMMLKTHPTFWSGSWGEQITLFLDGRDIWVNSICDPEKRASVVSMGRNRENVEILAHALSS
jgi:hypothetical protein